MPTLKTLKNLLKKIYFNIKYYRPTVFRVIALTLSVVLSISSVALIDYIQNLPKTPLERLTQIVFENTNLVESKVKVIKRLRVEQKNPSYLLSVIRDFIPSDIRLHSFEEYNDKVIFIGTSPLVETVNTFAKDLDFSRGLFTDVNLDLRAISEDEFYFKITCIYNKPVPAAYLENDNTSNNENSACSEPRQIIVKNVPVTEERKVEFLEKRLKDSYEELSALNEILPEYFRIGQVVQDITRKANFHNITVTNFKEYEPWQRDSYKRIDSILNVVGDYDNVIEFIKELGTSRLLISVSNITINKFVTQSFKQSVEVKIGLVMFSATKEDLSPLFSTTRAQFESQMINILGTQYIYLEDKTLEDAEEMAETEEYYEEESSEDYEEEQEAIPLRHNHNLETKTPTYVELRLSPFRD